MHLHWKLKQECFIAFGYYKRLGSSQKDASPLAVLRRESAFGTYPCAVGGMVATTQLSMRGYLEQVRSQLEGSLLAIAKQRPPSRSSEPPNYPEVELGIGEPAEPILVRRSEKETVLLERSSNSVRLSIGMKQADELEGYLCEKFSKFMMRRAEKFFILRRKAIEGYNISFLISNEQVQSDLQVQQVCDFVLFFMQEIDKEISDMKIDINARSRDIAEEFYRSLLQTEIKK